MAVLSNPVLSNPTTTSLDCAVDTDTGSGTIYYLVTTGATNAIEASAVVNFGQSISGFGAGTVNLGTWTAGLFPASSNPDNLYNRPYKLHVVQDDGGLSNKVVSTFLATLNDNEMFPPASTTRYIPYTGTSIAKADSLIQDWLRSGGNVDSDDSASLPDDLVEGDYVVTFTNPLSTTPNQPRTLRIRRTLPAVQTAFQFSNRSIIDGAGLTDNSEFWGHYKFGDYLFCAKGAASIPSDHGGLRVFDVSDPDNAVLVYNDLPQNSTGTGFIGNNRFVRTVQVQGTPGTVGAEAYVIYRSSPYTATDQDSMLYVYDISDANPANWTVRSPWAISHEYVGGPGSPAESVPLQSDFVFDGSFLYNFRQKSGVAKYDPADVSSPVAVNQNYTPRQFENQGGTADSDPSGYVYIAAYQNGLRIVPKSTLVDGRFSILLVLRDNGTALRPWDAILSADGNWLFLSFQSSDPVGTPSTSGLQVVDVHDPEKPQTVAFFVLPEADQDIFNGRHDQACVRINRFSLSNREYVVLANLKKGHAIFDVTDPTRPIYNGVYQGSLQQAGAQIDGVGHAEIWDQNGQTFIAYGDYGSLINQAGTKQLYIDQLTRVNDMAFVIGNDAAATGGGGTFVNQANSRGPNASYDYTAVTGDYVYSVRAAVAAQPASRTLSLGIYRKDTGDLFHSEAIVADPGGYPFTGLVTIPLAANVNLLDGVEFTFRITHVSGGTNWGLDNYFGTSGLAMRQLTNGVASTLPANLSTDANFAANDGIIALLGDNEGSSGRSMKTIRGESQPAQSPNYKTRGAQGSQRGAGKHRSPVVRPKA